MTDIAKTPTADTSLDVDSTRETVGIVRGGGANLLGTAFNQAARLAITVLLGRLLGGKAVGLFYQATAVLVMGGFVVSGGVQLALTRYVAVHRVEKDEAALHGVIRLGLIIPTALAAIFGTGVVLTAPWLGTGLFHDPEFPTLLRYLGIALPATVFTDLALAATRGYKAMKPTVYINLLFEPAVRLVLTVVLIAAGMGLNGAMLALVVTNTTAALLAAWQLKKRIGARVTPRYPVRELASFSALSWGQSLSSIAHAWADVLLLGIFLSARDVGVYVVATRLVLLSGIFIEPINIAVAPRIADLYQRKELAVLSGIYSMVAGWFIRLSLPGFIALLLYPRELLGLFGSDFTAGAGVTRLLAFGILIYAITGPCGFMLTMSGRVGVQFVYNFLALALNIGLNLALIPRVGILGAGIAWMVSLSLNNLVKAVHVWLVMKMQPVGEGVLKGLVAGGAALIATLLVGQAAGGLMGLFVGVAALLATYIIAMVALGFGSDDRLILDIVLRRVRLGST